MCLHSLKVSGSLLIPAGRLSCAYCKRLFITWQAVRTTACWCWAVLFPQYLIVFFLGWVGSPCRFDLLYTSSCSTRTLQLVLFQIHICVSDAPLHIHVFLMAAFFSNQYSAVELFIRLPVNLCVLLPSLLSIFSLLMSKWTTAISSSVHQIFLFGQRL